MQHFVVPRPSKISTPNVPCHRANRSDRHGSPADIHSLTLCSSFVGRLSLANSIANKVERQKKALAFLLKILLIISGSGGPSSKMALAPTAIGKVHFLARKRKTVLLQKKQHRPH